MRERINACKHQRYLAAQAAKVAQATAVITAGGTMLAAFGGDQDQAAFMRRAERNASKFQAAQAATVATASLTVGRQDVAA